MADRLGVPPLKIDALEQNSLRERSKHVIKSLVTTGQVKPGQIYPVSHFAVRLGVSATPVREALLDLVNDGLMEGVRNRGFRVPTLTNHDLNELLDLRLLLELPSIEHVAKLASPDHVEACQVCARETQEATREGNQVGFVEADMRFHLTLYAPLGNRRLREMLAIVKNQMCVFGLKPLTDTGRLEASAAEHAEIVDAVARGDGKAAAALMKAHLESIRRPE